MTHHIIDHSMYLQDFQAGLEIHTAARTITEADVVLFAGLSGDFHALHTDAVVAVQGPFGQRVAHGLLGLAIASGLAMQMGMLQGSMIAFRELTCKFSKPIYIGDTVHARLTVAEVRPIPHIGGGRVILNLELLNQRGEVVQVGDWHVLVRSRNDTGLERSSEHEDQSGG